MLSDAELTVAAEAGTANTLISVSGQCVAKLPANPIICMCVIAILRRIAVLVFLPVSVLPTCRQKKDQDASRQQQNQPQKNQKIADGFTWARGAQLTQPPKPRRTKPACRAFEPNGTHLSTRATGHPSRYGQRTTTNQSAVVVFAALGVLECEGGTAGPSSSKTLAHLIPIQYHCCFAYLVHN
eukprot:TRINITY_DN3911_c1_g1_i4.p1 TRINITY_DN3911_c1_g1~~TRINITY_DN3911_c1_g1_i4.p1  ORF type:complete len:183 (-),score=17.64 TRINITY_DN3911_c1_g1_i4:124-672(-)